MQRKENVCLDKDIAVTIEPQDLNSKFPIEELFSVESMSYVPTITKMGWSDILRYSPARNANAEILISKIIISAIENRGWIDIPFCENSPKLISIKFITIIENHMGEKLIRPTEKLIIFAKERLSKFAPQKNQP